MWFAVPPASSARQKLEMKGERITARSIRENTPAAAVQAEPERTLIANVVSVLGKILLIILKIFVVLLLICLVLGTSVLGFVMLCSIPLFAFDFITGLAFFCFILVIIIPLLVLIYLSIMLLVTKKPSGGFLLSSLILWIILLAGMTISAIKSPVRFPDQIENAFESAFSNDSDKLYEAFSEEEIADFRSKIGETYDPDTESAAAEPEQSENVTSKITFTLGNRTVNVVTKGDRQVIFCGRQRDVNHCSESLQFHNDNTQFDISDNTIYIVENEDNSVAVMNGDKAIVCDTETEESDAGPTATCSFTIDNVQVRYSHGPSVDSAKVTKEAIRDVLGAAGDVMDAAKEVVGAAGSVVKEGARHSRRGHRRRNAAGRRGPAGGKRRTAAGQRTDAAEHADGRIAHRKHTTTNNPTISNHDGSRPTSCRAVPILYGAATCRAAAFGTAGAQRDTLTDPQACTNLCIWRKITTFARSVSTLKDNDYGYQMYRYSHLGRRRPRHECGHPCRHSNRHLQRL